MELLRMTSSCRPVPCVWMVLQREFMPRVILKNMFNLPYGVRRFEAWFHSMHSHSQHKSLTIAETEVVSLVRRWGTLLMNLAVLRWTISSWSTYFCWYESQIQEQYSSLGRAIALYDFFFNCCGHLFRDRQRNPNKRFAAPLILSIGLCSFHQSLQFIVIAQILSLDWRKALVTQVFKKRDKSNPLLLTY